MELIVGIVLGVGLTLAVRGVLTESLSLPGVEKPDRAASTDRKTWSQTKNFLYYDGSVMPEIKEDANEH